MDNLRKIFGGGDQPQSGGNPIEGVRHQIEKQVGTVIDRVANKVPGSEQYATQCKQTISSALQSFQSNVERIAGDRLGDLKLGNIHLGGLMGQGDQPPPPPSS